MPFAYHPLTDPTAKADFPDSPDDGRVTDLGNDVKASFPRPKTTLA